MINCRKHIVRDDLEVLVAHELDLEAVRVAAPEKRFYLAPAAGRFGQEEC